MSLYGVKISLDYDYVSAVDTYSAWGLFLLEDGFSIGAPELKTNNIDVPGMDGTLDASDVPQGYPVYNNRPIAFKLFRDESWEGTETLRQTLMGRFHGRRVRIILPTDTERYYVGRISVGDLTQRREIPVTASVYPYKLASRVETYTVDADEQTLVIQNGARYVIPQVTITQSMVLQMQQGIDGLPAAVTLYVDEPGVQKTFTVPELLMLPGENRLTARTLLPYEAELALAWKDGVF